MGDLRADVTEDWLFVTAKRKTTQFGHNSESTQPVVLCVNLGDTATAEEEFAITGQVWLEASLWSEI
jgi:hypothetical protein